MHVRDCLISYKNVMKYFRKYVRMTAKFGVLFMDHPVDYVLQPILRYVHLVYQARIRPDSILGGCGTPESGPFGPNPPHKSPFYPIL